MFLHVMKNNPILSEKLFAFFALSADQSAPNEIQVLPFGRVETDKGTFLVDDQAIRAMMQQFASKKNDIVIDYEHQTLKDVVAPAAAWIKKLINKGKDGLWAEVEWTPRAKEFILNKEYRYLSPVVFSRKSDGRAVILHSCGLTNTPAIDGMEPIANKDSEVETNMEFLKKLAALLGLPETATEDEISQALVALKQKLEQAGQVVANKDILALLELSDNAALADVKGKIIALKNPSGYVKVEEFKALQDKLAARDRDELVELALKSGKVAPAQKAWAEQYALKDPEGFKAFIKDAPVVVPITEVAGGSVAKKVTDEVQLQINKMLDVSEEDFKKFGGE